MWNKLEIRENNWINRPEAFISNIRIDKTQDSVMHQIIPKFKLIADNNQGISIINLTADLFIKHE
jgi:hypothetical protein